MEKYDVYLGLGSNIGDRLRNMDAALSMLGQLARVQILQVSSLFETLPVGPQEQPLYLNAAVHIQTTFAPHALLEHCRQIEMELGRVRTVRWGPRTIDIDILYVTGVVLQSEELYIPHPRAAERSFVMVPLAQISPDYTLPDGRIARQVAESLGNEGIAVFYDEGWKRRWRCSDMKQ